MFFNRKRKGRKMLKIYGVPISVHTRKVIVSALHKDIPYESVPVIPFEPPENWRSLSPTGLIPAISHDGFETFDSNAICAYLEKVKPSHSLYPSDARAFGRALAFEQYATNAVFGKVVQPLFFQKVIKPNILKQGPADPAEITRVETEEAPQIFSFLNEQLESGKYFSGNAFSIADLAITSNLINYQYLGFHINRDKYPNFARVFASNLTLPAFAKALEAEKPFVAQMGLDRSFLE